MKRFYDDETMNFAVLLSLGFAYHGIADVERAIERAKHAVLALPVDSPQRRPLVEHLVALRLRRDELRS